MNQNTSKKICVLTHSLDTKRGSGRFTTGLVTHLRKDAGYEVSVLTTLPGSVQSEENILYSNPFKLAFSFLRIRKIIRESDIVHALDLFPYGIIACLAALGLKKRIVITAIGSGSIQPFHRPGLSLLAKWAARRANTLTAISSYVAREVAIQVPGINPKVIIPGIEYDYFLKKKSTELSVHQRPFVLSVAKVKPRKGIDVSIRTFAEASKQLPELEYVIVGVHGGEYFDEIRKLVAELGVAGKVFFKERISDEELVSLYTKAELFIMLSQNVDNDVEGFGLVFVEAAAFGIPVIGAKDCGAEDAILDGKNGYLVSPKDVLGAADKIVRIVGNPVLKEKLSRESIEFAKRCDWKTIVRQYTVVYELLFRDTI